MPRSGVRAGVPDGRQGLIQVSRSIGEEREASASLFCLEAGGRCSSSIRRSIPRESAIQKSAMIISAGPVGKAGVTWQGINPASGGQTRRRRLLDSFSWERSEEHTSELQSLMRISYAVFCLTKKKLTQQTNRRTSQRYTS